MSQFDQTTEKKALTVKCATLGGNIRFPGITGAYTEGRNSTKASMELACRSLKYIKEEIENLIERHGGEDGLENCSKRSLILLKKHIESEIKKIKANGDWTPEEKV